MYYYDVNSLYPWAALNDIPGMECTLESSIAMKFTEDLAIFGFFYCNIYKGVTNTIDESGYTVGTSQRIQTHILVLQANYIHLLPSLHRVGRVLFMTLAELHDLNVLLYIPFS